MGILKSVLLCHVTYLIVQLMFSGCIQYRSGVLNSFSPGGHISLEEAFKGPNVILGPYKCNYSLTRVKELGAAAG